jgi:ribosomal protein L24
MTIKVQKVKHYVLTVRNKAIVEGVNMVSKHTKPSKKALKVVCRKKLLFKYLTYL